MRAPSVRWRRPAPGSVVLVTAAALGVGLPLLSLLVRALADVWRAPALLPQRFGTRGLDIAFGGDGALGALATSAFVAGATTVVAVLLAWPAARVLGERRLRHPGGVYLLLALPLLVPPYAVGTGLTEWFIRLGLAGTPPGLVLAHLTVVLPYAVLLLVSAFGPSVRELEEMGRAAGLSRTQRLRWVTLPAVRPTLVTALLLSALVSWSQYGTSLAVAPTRPTLPVLLLPFVGADPQVAATLSVLFVAPALVALVATVRVVRRST